MQSQKKSRAESSSRPLPEDPGADGEDQHLLEEPEAGPDVGSRRRVIHLRPGLVDLPGEGILPADLHRFPHSPAQAPHRPDIVGVVPPREVDPTHGQQLVSDLRPFVPSLGVPPDEIVGDFLLDIRAEHATDADGPHPGDVGQDHHRVEQDPGRTGQAKDPKPGSAPMINPRWRAASHSVAIEFARETGRSMPARTARRPSRVPLGTSPWGFRSG